MTSCVVFVFSAADGREAVNSLVFHSPYRPFDSIDAARHRGEPSSLGQQSRVCLGLGFCGNGYIVHYVIVDKSGFACALQSCTADKVLLYGSLYTSAELFSCIVVNEGHPVGLSGFQLSFRSRD